MLLQPAGLCLYRALHLLIGPPVFQAVCHRLFCRNNKTVVGDCTTSRISLPARNPLSNKSQRMFRSQDVAQLQTWPADQRYTPLHSSDLCAHTAPTPSQIRWHLLKNHAGEGNALCRLLARQHLTYRACCRRVVIEVSSLDRCSSLEGS